MPAELRIGGQSRAAIAAAEGVKAAMAQLKVSIAETQAASVEAAKVQVQASRAIQQAQETLAATTVEGGRLVVEQQVKKVAALREEITVARQVAASYKIGSDEQAVAVQRVNRLLAEQIGLLGRTGEASVAAGAAGRGGGFLGASGRFTGSAGAEESGLRRGFLSRATGIGGFIAGPGFIAGAVTAIALKQASDALRKIQEETSQLQGAVVNAGKSWTVYRHDIDETVKAMEELGIKQSDTLQGMTALVRVTGSVAKAEQQMALAVNISRGAHIHLDQAVMAVVQADNGRFRGLQRLIGPTVAITKHMDELKNAHIKVTNANRDLVTSLQHRAAAMDKAETSQKVLAAAEQKFAGEAQRHMKTAEGATDLRRVAIERLEVSIGKGLLPIEHDFNEALAKGADFLRTNKSLAEALHNVGVLLGAAWKVVAETFKILGEILDTRVGRAFQKIMVIGISPAAAILAHWQQLKTFFANFWRFIENGFMVAWDAVKLSALYAYKGILEPFSHLPGGFGGWARKAKVAVDQEMDSLKSDMAARGEDAGTAWGRAFGKSVLDSATNAAATAQQAMEAAGTPTIARGSGHGRSIDRVVGTGGAQRQASALRVAGPSLGTVAVARGANARGVSVKPVVILFVRRMASIVGHPLTITTGTNHKEFVSGSNNQTVSDHWGGNAADIAARGADLVEIGQAALIAAGLSPEDAGKHNSFAGTVQGVNILFNVKGPFGDHTNHCHVGLHALPSGFNVAGEHGDRVTVTADPAAETALTTDIGKAKKQGISTGTKTPKYLGMPTPGPGGGSVDKMAAKHHLRPMYGQTLVNYIATKSKGLGLDPAAVLAVASVEGGFSGAPGDYQNGQPTSFGPFQLHIGGALPSRVANQGVLYARAWANSAEGIDYALGKIAEVAGGETGGVAVTSIVTGFEHPAQPGPEIGRAVGRLGQQRFTIGSLQGTDAGIQNIKQALQARIDLAKQLQQMTKAATMAARPRSLDDIFGDISGRRASIESLGMTVSQALGFLDAPLRAAVVKAEARIAQIRARMAAAIRKGLVTPAQLRLWQNQLRQLGVVVDKGLTEAAIRAQHAADNAINKIRREFQRRQQAQLDAFDEETKNQINAMRKSFEQAMKEFDRETQRGLQRFVVGQTPEEAALKAFQDQRAQQQRAKQLAQLQGDLATAMAGGDSQAIAAAQDAINQAVLDEQEKGLQDAADQSRKAQDQKTSDQQQAYQDERDALRQHLEEQEQAQEDSYQKIRDIARQGLEDLLADQADQFDTDIEVWQAWLRERAQALDEFYAAVKEKYGIGPGNQDVGGRLGRQPDESLHDAIIRSVTGAGPQGGIPMQHGGTIRRPASIRRADVIDVRAHDGETFIDETLTKKLELALASGNLGGGITVVVPNAVLLGRDREIARTIAEIAAPEIERRIGYTPLM